MATAIALIGKSSSGKSTSLRNLPAQETFIISPSKGELPIPKFKQNYKKAAMVEDKLVGNFSMMNDFQTLYNTIHYINEHRLDIKTVVTEDMTHFFTAVTLSEEFKTKGESKDGSWSRWADFGRDVFQALFKDLLVLREDLTLVFQFHTDMYTEGITDKFKLKTPGSLLEREVDIPSYFNYVLYTKVLPPADLKPSERYKFVTNDDGRHPAKTPYGLFEELEIENDLNEVIKAIQTY